jgi:nucleotide-binding universal stress UspA family protein
MKKIERILVVSRSTLHCRIAVHQGITLARAYGAKLYVVHVVHDPFNMEGWNLPVPTFHDEYKKLIARYKKELHEIIEKEKGKGDLEVIEWIRDGDPVDEVIKIVESEHIDLIIMLSHEEGRLEHFLFGRSNEKILRKMPCSILFVKHGY